MVDGTLAGEHTLRTDLHILLPPAQLAAADQSSANQINTDRTFAAGNRDNRARYSTC